MNKNNKINLIIISITISLSLACTSIYNAAVSPYMCEILGGVWHEGDVQLSIRGSCEQPSPNIILSTATPTIQEAELDTQIKPSSNIEENTSTNENNNQNTTESSTLEYCSFPSDQFYWEFININHDNSNETKKVCRGEFLLQNDSNEKFEYKLFKVWDNGAMQDIGWQLPGILSAKKELSLPIESQTWSDHATISTYTKIIVFYSSSECHQILTNPENEQLWEQEAILLTDPCSVE